MVQKPLKKNSTLPGSVTEFGDKLIWGNQDIVTEQRDISFERGARGTQALSTVDLIQISLSLYSVPQSKFTWESQVVCKFTQITQKARATQLLFGWQIDKVNVQQTAEFLLIYV